MLRRDQKKKSYLVQQFMLTSMLVLALAIFGCTYTREGMTEWDYKALTDGYVMECKCCGDEPACRWTNGTSVNGTNSSDH